MESRRYGAVGGMMTTETPKRYTSAEIDECMTFFRNKAIDEETLSVIEQIYSDLHEAKKTLSWYANKDNYDAGGYSMKLEVGHIYELSNENVVMIIGKAPNMYFSLGANSDDRVMYYCWNDEGFPMGSTPSIVREIKQQMIITKGQIHSK